MLYDIIVRAKVESDLIQSAIENRLVIALHNTDETDEDLKVIDYEFIEASEVCPNCEINLVSKMFDIDSTNLVERDICEKCGYGMPALI